MNADRLVEMANQIADFFRPQSGDQVADVAAHMRAYWTPAMRRDAYAHLDAGAAGLDALARAGIERMRAGDARAAQGDQTARA